MKDRSEGLGSNVRAACSKVWRFFSIVGTCVNCLNSMSDKLYNNLLIYGGRREIQLADIPRLFSRLILLNRLYYNSRFS